VTRLGPLAEREFRLLFAGQAISRLGTAMAPVALAFAVLELTGSASDLGLVLTARMLPTIVFLLVGGVWADRLPRHRVMVASNLLSGASQVTAGALLLTGAAQLWQLGALAAVNGASSAFFQPASAGIVPETVPSSLLQQANATLRLAINSTTVTGAALGGLLVAATNPGTAVVLDGISYVLAAACLGAMRLPAGLRIEGGSVIHELREGWHDFWSRTWLWAIVIQFGIVNAVVSGTQQVLGPVVADEHLGGAAGWGAALAAESIGYVLCGFVMLRWRVRRMLRAATLAVFGTPTVLVALAVPAPLAVVIVAAFATGVCIEIFGVLWDTSMQEQIPQEKLSRLYSYDMLGSWALIPLGYIAAGPVSEAIGVTETFVAATVVIVVATALVLLSHDVRTLERRPA
jgi:MFS family permease